MIKSLIQQRNSLVDAANEAGPQMERSLSEILASAYADDDTEAAFNSALALRHKLMELVNFFKLDDAQKSNRRTVTSRTKQGPAKQITAPKTSGEQKRASGTVVQQVVIDDVIRSDELDVNFEEVYTAAVDEENY